MSDFAVKKDSDTTITGSVTDANGDAVDIGGASITWAVLKQTAGFAGDLDTVAAGGSIVKATGGSGVAISGDGSAGQYTVTIADTDTHTLPPDDYYVLVRLTTAGGSILPIPRATMTLGV